MARKRKQPPIEIIEDDEEFQEQENKIKNLKFLVKILFTSIIILFLISFLMLFQMQGIQRDEKSMMENEKWLISQWQDAFINLIKCEGEKRGENNNNTFFK